MWNHFYLVEYNSTALSYFFCRLDAAPLLTVLQLPKETEKSTLQ